VKGNRVVPRPAARYPRPGTVKHSDEALAQVVVSNHYASARDVEHVQAWGARYHPEKDLAELLFMKGMIDRGQVSLVRRLAKMTSGRGRRASGKAPRRAKAVVAVDPKETSGASDGPAADGADGERHDDGDDDVAESEKETGVLSSSARRRGPTKWEDPERVGRYEIVERVARGGMGVVYKARHPELDRVFALKVLTPRVEATDEALTRFQREAKIAARLDHPNIVRVHDAGTDEAGHPYLVMDFVDGLNLDRVVKEEGLGVRKAARIGRAVGYALQHAHEHGVVHRDVKPENVILDRSTGEPKVTDFGIVKDLADRDEEAKLTQTGFTLGSPCYMSPEQAAGRHEEVGAASDVYSLAATLYEMLTGEPPFDGESIHEIMTRVIRDDAVPLRSKNPAIPRDLEVVCMKALEKEPARRYPTAADFADDLGRFLAEDPVRAKPAGVGTKGLRLLRRHRAAAGISVAFGLFLLAAGAYLLHERRQRAREAADRRAALLDSAEESLERAGVAGEDAEKRRAYYDALLSLERILSEVPDHEEAVARKREVVLELGDHLVASGEASFAEFVFTLGSGLVDEEVISSRLAAARLGRWEEAARAEERDGDLPEALRLYRTGRQELADAGYSVERLDARIARLEESLAARRRAERIEELLAVASAAAVDDDPIGALEAALDALELSPDHPRASAAVARYEQQIDDRYLQAEAEARGARERLMAAAQEHLEEELFGAALAEADAALARGEAARADGEHRVAIRELEEAGARFAAALDLTTALQARGRALTAEARAADSSADRFAPRELAQGREHLARADALLQRGEYEAAVSLYDRAAHQLDRARLTGSGKEGVSEARLEARDARSKAFAALGPDHRLPKFEHAEEEFNQAEGLYRREEYAQASELYQRAREQFARVTTLAPATRDAYALRARVRELRQRCARDMAETFEPELLAEGVEAEAEAEQLLERSDPVGAGERYRRAVYKLDRASERSRPEAEGYRECRRLRERAVALRDALEAEFDWKPAFRDGLEDLKEGQRYEADRDWHLAERRYERAIRHFDALR